MSAAYLPFIAAAVSVLLAIASLIRKRSSPASWFLVAGMTVFSLESLLAGLALSAARPEQMAHWLRVRFTTQSVLPVFWLCFSVTYSRGDYRRFLRRWRLAIICFALVPAVAWLAPTEQVLRLVVIEPPDRIVTLQFGALAKVLSGVLLVALVLALANLEQTFRATVGTMRWRIKFVIVGLGLIFGTRIFVHSQTILFSAPDLDLYDLDAVSLLIGSGFLVLAYLRTGWAEVDVYPSQAVLRSSLTVLVAGGYLFIVGVVAQAVRRFGGSQFFQFQAVILLLATGGLAVLLFSDRVRQRIHVFAVRHFRKAQHDSVRVWALFSRQLASVRDEASLCSISVKLVAEVFDVLSVTVWLVDEGKSRLVAGASTGQQPTDSANGQHGTPASSAVVGGLQDRAVPFDLEEVSEPWAEEFRGLSPAAFSSGGNRWCVPLQSGSGIIGVVVLADRVGGLTYTVEELELLGCIADHVTAVVLNLRLATEVAQAKELEAFRTMSAFFVHDLKNAASSLNLTLKNLPVHFDDPRFRADALRAVGNTATRIDDTIARLSALKQRPDTTPVEADLNQIVNDVLHQLESSPSVELTAELQPLPRMLVDREQIQSVVTNLVLNAQESMTSGGRITVRTVHQNGDVVLSVADNGCGMSQNYLKERLFKPFQSTKKKGLGIGLFQSRAIVQAHGGRLQVESEPGKGSMFQVTLPVKVGK